MILKPVISRERIQRRVSELADEIGRFYEGKDLVAVCVLKGAFVFFSDLVRALRMDVTLDFVRLSSYGNSMESSRQIKLTKDVEAPVRGRDVLIVEDIIDSGQSLSFLAKHLEGLGASSVRIATLIDKKERRETDVRADFSGFSMPSGFIVGYGLDFAERYRNLDAVYELCQSADEGTL